MEVIFNELVVIFILILVNGFFAASELAVISARKSRIASLAAAGNAEARLVEQIQKNPHRFLATVQIGVTVIGSLASAVGGAAAIQHLKPLLKAFPLPIVRHAAEPLSIAIVVIGISYFFLVLGELAPKTIGLQYADRLALRVVRPIHFLSVIAVVGVRFLTFSNRAILSLFGIKPKEGHAFVTREEVQQVLSEGSQAGALTETEHRYIRNIFEFTHTCVREVMVPRTRIVALNLDLPKEEILRTVQENMYSRYPVYRGDLEHVLGFVHTKDILVGRMSTGSDFAITGIIRNPLFVPEGKKVSSLLKEMQRKRIQLALVVDEYGVMTGLATTEDLLEELVGEIEDEHDVGEARRFQKLPDGSLMVDALLPVNDVEDLLGVDLGDFLPYDTLAGLILERLGRFPEKGETLEWQNYILTCEEVTETSILKVRVAPLEKPGGSRNPQPEDGKPQRG
ncbi:MAG: hemolysin family protein [Proteobacteria bacterium]|nr:hemolysin family protein [Pseudomonadota bacterium]MBU2226780.1 hemolysin family protein [Pseudomonadota bacterium]MBU2262402.1 hemolysin family protein [Pseudomonadota bacterium]